MAASPSPAPTRAGQIQDQPSCSTDDRVPHSQVQPKEGTLRVLTPNPPPYVHPRILFADEDRGDLERTAHRSNVGSAAFNQLSAWVDKVVYDARSPIKQLFDSVTSTISDEKPYGDPNAGFEAIKQLVTDKGKGGAVLLGSFYSRLFELGKTPPYLGPADQNVMQSNTLLVKPPQKDTSAEMGAKILFYCGEGGVPTYTPPIYHALQNAAYVAWLNKDAARLTSLTAMLGAAAAVHLTFRAPVPPSLIRGVRSFVPDAATGQMLDGSICPELAMAYDFLAAPLPDGSPDDRRRRRQLAAARRLLLQMGKNQVLSGFQAEMFARKAGPGLMPHFTTGTFQIMTSLVFTVHCAVEWEVDNLDDRVEEEERREEGRRREAEERPSGGWRECDGVQERKDVLKYDVYAAELTAMGMQYYMTYGGANDSTGITRESPGYFMTAMRQAAFPLLAAQRRGWTIFPPPSPSSPPDSTTTPSSSTCAAPTVATASSSNALLRPNSYRVLMDVLQTMAPWSSAPPCFGSHDGSTFCGGFGQSEYYLVLAYLYPDDPLVRFIYQKYNTDLRTRAVGNCGVSKMPFQTCLLGVDPQTVSIPYADVAAAAKLPLAFFANRRGMGVARSAWDDGATRGSSGDGDSDSPLMLTFECRGDMYSLAHGHCNRNDFFLYGRGRAWLPPAPYHNTEAEAHTGVMVDGVGQGGSSTVETPEKVRGLWSHIPGRIVETFDSARFCLFAGDATDAYRYASKTYQWARENPDPKGDNPLQTPLQWGDYYYEREVFGPLLVPAGAKDSQTGTKFTVGEGEGGDVAEGGGPRPIWVQDDSWTRWKVCCAATEFNPVKYAFRTACMVRGGRTRSYAIVADDIVKDDGGKEHALTWFANTTQPFMPGIGSGQRLFFLQRKREGGGKGECAALGESEVRVSEGEAKSYSSLNPDTDAIFCRGDDVDALTSEQRTARPNSPRLLLRVLQGEGRPSPMRIVKVPKGSAGNGQPSGEYWRLEVKREATADAKFKVLLLPFRAGEPLPLTSWETPEGEGEGKGEGKEVSQLVVAWSGDGGEGKRESVDRIRFEKGEEGRTRVRLVEV